MLRRWTKRWIPGRGPRGHDRTVHPPVADQSRSEEPSLLGLDADSEEIPDAILGLTKASTSGRGPVLLCEQCAAIDFKKYFGKSRSHPLGSFVLVLDPTKNARWATCAACRFFASVETPLFDPDMTARRVVRYARVLGIYTFEGLAVEKFDGKGLGNASMLDSVIVPLLDHDESLQEAELSIGVEPMTGYPRFPEMVKGWIEKCEQDHHSVCVASICETEFPKGLKLIDGKKRTVITAQADMRYLALSYVWGSDSSDLHDTTVDGLLPATLPRTVGDAIRVTTALGYDYLWVDKYCIDQNDAEAKHAQIRQMDLIYRRAHMTIVAAAGHGSSYGLPGVSRMQTTPTHSVRLNDLSLIALPRSPQRSVKESLWMRRGWTFQEGFLSTRRLLFTDQQILFECHQACSCQYFPDTWETLYTAKIFGDSSSAHRYPWHIARALSEYSRRELSFPSDAINAFEGIINSFGTEEVPIAHHFGALIMPAAKESEEQKTARLRRTESGRLLAGLCWRHKEYGTRRAEFPSWSWAGWTCSLKENHKELSQGLRLAPDDYPEILLEGRDGELVRYEDLSNADRSSQTIGRVLRIEAWTIPLTFRKGSKIASKYSPPIHSNKIYAVFEDGVVFEVMRAHFISRSHEKMATGSSTAEDSNSNGEYRGVWMSGSGLPSYMLIVENVGPFYRRVGHLVGYAKCRTITADSGATFMEWADLFLLSPSVEREDILALKDAKRMSIRLA